MEGSSMKEMVDLLNRLAEKYKFEEDDINDIRKIVFKIENGEDSLLNAEEEFKNPDGEDVEETDFEFEEKD